MGWFGIGARIGVTQLRLTAPTSIVNDIEQISGSTRQRRYSSRCGGTSPRSPRRFIWAAAGTSSRWTSPSASGRASR